MLRKCCWMCLHFSKVVWAQTTHHRDRMVIFTQQKYRMPSWLWMADKTNFKIVFNYSLFIWNSNECGYVVFWFGSLPLGWWMSSRWGIGGRTEKTILGRDKLMDVGSSERFSWWWRTNPQCKKSSHTHMWYVRVCVHANI